MGCTVGTILGTRSLPSAHSIDGKGRFKFGKVVRIQIVFERGHRDTFNDTSGKTVPKKTIRLKNESLKREVLQRIGVRFVVQTRTSLL